MTKTNRSRLSLANALMNGYVRGAEALSMLVNQPAVVDLIHNCLYGEDAIRFIKEGDFAAPRRRQYNTALFGDWSGKSYLLLSEAEMTFFCRTLPGSDPTQQLKTEFLKEIANIVSAAIVTQLANTLQQKILGDVPMDDGEVGKSFNQSLVEEHRHCPTVYISTATFTFDEHPGIKPLMIWVLCSTDKPTGRHP